jgi:hypothetical protein
LEDACLGKIISLLKKYFGDQEIDGGGPENILMYIFII